MALSAAQLFSVAGRRVLVTGGGSGIGAMVAEGFAANGARVTIASRNEKALEETAARIRESTGGEIDIAVADLASREGCEALAKDFERPARRAREQQRDELGRADRTGVGPRELGLGQGFGFERQGPVLPDARAPAGAARRGEGRGPRARRQRRLGRGRRAPADADARATRPRRRCTTSRASSRASSRPTSRSTPSRRASCRRACRAASRRGGWILRKLRPACRSGASAELRTWRASASSSRRRRRPGSRARSSPSTAATSRGAGPAGRGGPPTKLRRCGAVSLSSRSISLLVSYRSLASCRGASQAQRVGVQHASCSIRLDSPTCTN